MMRFLAVFILCSALAFPQGKTVNGVANQSVGMSGNGAPNANCALGDFYTQNDAVNGATLWTCSIAGIQWTNNATGALSFSDTGSFPASPTAWHNYASASGSSLPDGSGNGNNGTLVASPTIGGTGVTFNGTSQYVTMPAGVLTFKTVMICGNMNFHTNTGNAYHAYVGNATSSEFAILATDSNANAKDSGPVVWWGNQGGFLTKSAVGFGPTPSCLTYEQDNTGDKFYINGVQVAQYQYQAPTGSLTRIGTVQLFASTGNSFFTPATGYVDAFWSTELSDNNVKIAYARALAIMKANSVSFAAYTNADSDNKLIELADSICANSGEWCSLISPTTTYTVITAAQGGRYNSWLMNQLPAIVQATPSTGLKRIIFDIGTNDMCGGTPADTPFGVYTKQVAGAAIAHAAGYSVIVISMLSRGTTGGVNCDAAAATYNALLSNSTAFDAVVDLAAYARANGVFDFTAANASANTQCFSDTIHPTTTLVNTGCGGNPGSTGGAGIITAAVQQALNALDAPSTPKSYVTPGLQVAHALYSFGVDGGATGAITPSITANIPAKAILIGGSINVTTAITSGGLATVSMGTSAGSGAASIMAATAVASLTSASFQTPAITFATPIKMSAAGNINVTIATAALTAGVIEAFVYYVLPQN